MEDRLTQAMQPDVSVIICTYTEDRWGPVCAAVESVRQQTVSPREIIIVVDHNPALLTRAQAEWLDLVVVENHEKRGLSGARNSGVAAAHGAWLAFLDDDAVAEPAWLEKILECTDDTRVLGVGTDVEPVWETARPAWFPEEFLWVVGCSYRGLPETQQPVRNLFGGSMCLKHEIFTKVGGFLHTVGRVGTTPLGCEETELCIRARQYWPQHIFLYEPQVRVQHWVPARRATWAYFRARCFAEGRSKAMISRSIGAGDGLSSERAYTLKVLPQGVLRNVAAVIGKRDPMGLARAGAIVAGLLITTAGYVKEWVAQRLSSDSQQSIDLANESPHNGLG